MMLLPANTGRKKERDREMRDRDTRKHALLFYP